MPLLLASQVGEVFLLLGKLIVVVITALFTYGLITHFYDTESVGGINPVRECGGGGV